MFKVKSVITSEHSGISSVAIKSSDDLTLSVFTGPVVLEGTRQFSSSWLPHADKLLLEWLTSQN